MDLKSISAAAAAALIISVPGLMTAFADWDTGNAGQYQETQAADTYDNTYDNTTADQTYQEPAVTTADQGSTDTGYDYDVTAVTVTTSPQVDYDPRQSVGNAVTTTTTTAYGTRTDKLVAPAKVYAEAGEIEDGQVKVKIKIESESLISNASLAISYDNTVLEYKSFTPAEKAGGMVVENVFSDRFVYNYVNQEGSDLDGTYLTLTFGIVDEMAQSAVVYVNVNSLDDEDMLSIPYSTENGIIRIAEEEKTEDEVSYEGLPVVEVHYTEEPIDPSDLGLAKVKFMVIEDDYMVEFRNGMLYTLAQGETRIEITHADDTKERIVLKITPPAEESSEDAVDAAVVLDSEGKEDIPDEPEASRKDRKSLYIMLAVAAAIVALIAEYLLIMKPFGKKKRRKVREAVREPEDPEDRSDMLAELEKAIAAKNTRENERRMEEGIASTAQINSVLVNKGFVLTDDDDDDIGDS